MDQVCSIILSLFSKDMLPEDKVNLIVALFHLTNIKIKKSKDELKNNIRKHKLLFADNCKPIVIQLKSTQGYSTAYNIYEEHIKQKDLDEIIKVKNLIYKRIEKDIMINKLEDITEIVFN